MATGIHTFNIYNENYKPLWTTHIFLSFTILGIRYKVLFSYLLFQVKSFAFLFVECQKERDGLGHERYFWIASEIDFTGSYFHRAGKSGEPQLSTNLKYRARLSIT